MQNFSLIYLFKKISNYIVISFLLLLFVNSCDESIPGCMDSTACNFNSSATTDDDSCTYPQPNFDCSGECLLELDCADVCGGSTVIDCNGVCGGGAEYDCIYDPDNEDTWEISCGGTLTLDCADICGGSATTDCAGVCNGNAELDCAGVCDGGAEYDPDTNCCGDEAPGCTGNCDGSYIDCTGDEGNEMDDNCCEPQTNNECLVILDDGDEQTQIDFCETNFSDNIIFEEECKLLNISTLDEFCEFHFGCATYDSCSGKCAGGNTGNEYYEVCDCFDSNAYNYWCNDGGTCPAFGSYETINALNCQDECITGVSGSYNPCNPATQPNCGIDTEISAFNDVEQCCYTGCNDSNAANYDENCNEDYGTCQTVNYLKIGTIDEKNSTIEILINSSDEIGGFQFNVEDINMSGASGGSAGSAGFQVATGPNGALGFSFTGSSIPPTNGEEEILTIITYTNAITTACMPLSELVLSDLSGASLTEGVNIPYIIHYQSSCP